MQKEVGSMMVTGVVSSRMVMTEIAEEKWKMCKFHTFYFFFSNGVLVHPWHFNQG